MIADAYDQRRSHARGDQHVRMIAADDPKGEAAFELLQRLPHRQKQVPFVKRSDQMRDDL